MTVANIFAVCGKYVISQSQIVQFLLDSGCFLSLVVPAPKLCPSARANEGTLGRRRSSVLFTNKAVGSPRADAKGRVINNYRVENKIGEGSFGVVYKVEHVPTGDVYAMKVSIVLESVKCTANFHTCFYMTDVARLEVLH